MIQNLVWVNVKFSVYHAYVLLVHQCCTIYGSGITSDNQDRYKPVTKCTYWPVLGEFNKRNIIELSSKSTSTEKFDAIHQVVLDGISDNIASLVESGKYGAINTKDTSTNGFYVMLSLIPSRTT